MLLLNEALVSSDNLPLLVSAASPTNLTKAKLGTNVTNAITAYVWVFISTLDKSNMCKLDPDLANLTFGKEERMEGMRLKA
jgi:hypothetical protein